MTESGESTVAVLPLLEAGTVSTSVPPFPAVSRARSPSLFKPHQRGKPVTSGQKRAALNVYSRLRARNQSKSVCDMVILASELTGISFKSLLRIRKDFRSGVKLTTHGKQRPNARGKRSRLALLDSTVLEAIQRTVKNIRDRNEVATPAKVCQIINANGDLPDFNPRTMQRILGDLGYTTKQQLMAAAAAAEGNAPPPPTDHIPQPTPLLPSLDRSYDDATLSAIRRKIHEFHGRREIPAAPRVLQAINTDDLLPDVSERTLRRVVGDVGFDVVRRGGGRDAVLMERDEVVLRRRRYLRQIWHFRQQGRPVYYVDETWLPCANPRERQEDEDDGVMVVLAGNERGILSGTECVQCSKKGHDATRPEMDATRFETWFVGQLLPNVEPESVIVLDDASCHTVKTEVIPDEASEKAAVQQWLTDKGVAWFPDAIKRELLVQVDKVRRQYDEYRLDVLASLDSGHTVLRLPPRHGELNPAETVCDQLRALVVSEGGSLQVSRLEVLVRGCLTALTPDHWASCVAHALQEEERMWQVDAQADADDVERRDGDDASSGHESSDDEASDEGSSGGE